MKKTSFLIFTFFLFFSLLISCGGERIEIQAIEGQTALIANRKKEFEIKENNLKSYLSYSKNILVSFESCNLNRENNNVLVIGNHEIKLDTYSGEKNVFTKTELNILGANIKDNQLKLSFKAGTDSFGKMDRFSLRNVYIKIGNQEIWSKEYTKENALNLATNLGSNQLKTDYRFNYKEQRDYNFSVPSKVIDCQAILVEDNLESYQVVQNSKEESILNPAHLNIDINILDKEVINETRKLQISTSNNVETVLVSMDGVKVSNDIEFSKNAWANGQHTLDVYATNTYGYVAHKEIDFTLADLSKVSQSIQYNAYDPGLLTELGNDVSALGTKVSSSDYETAFGSDPVLNFEVTSTSVLDIMWEGLIPVNRTAFLQVYNPTTKEYQTMSTKVCKNEDEKISLGFSKENANAFITEGKVYIRVGNKNLNKVKSITANIFHVTDVQYMVQKAVLDAGTVSEDAISALETISSWLIENKENSYSIMTGDFVQTMKNADAEWKACMQYLMTPLLENGVRLGASAGNHDVGGLRENSVDGGNALDSELYYDKFSKHLGENVFKKFDYYGGSYKDNRSHYDKLNLGGHEFIFLYLGWGSSTKGLHVSDQDIAYAKTVLEANPDTDVILSTHEYMGNKNVRTSTGEYVFDQLVKKYSNIKMVLSGHVNGASRQISAVDDDLDGITDRQVIELLYDFQEEDSTLGSSYIRKMGLDYTNNQIICSVYSPYFNDMEIEVEGNPEIVKNNLNFVLDYNLTNVGYGMKSFGLK